MNLKFFWLIPLIFLPLPQVFAVEIDNAYVQVTSIDSHTGDTNWTDISGASLSSGNFTTGDQYLLIFRSDIREDSTGASGSIRPMHGSTAFSDLEFSFEPAHSLIYSHYATSIVWTAVSGEGVKLQFKTSNSAQTVYSTYATITAINLDDLTENTDWYYDEMTTDKNLDTNWLNGTSDAPVITFTPNGSDDWLIMGTAKINVDSASETYASRLNADNSTYTPKHRQEGENASNDLQNHFLTRVFTPSASSHSYSIETQQEGATGTGVREYANIFALRLNSFEDHGNTYKALDSSQHIGPTITSATTENSLTIVPTQTGKFFAMSFYIFDPSNANQYSKERVQTNSTDTIPSQTTNDIYQFYTWSADDELNEARVFVDTFSGSSTIETQTSQNSVTEDLRDMEIVSFSMELASAGGPITHQVAVSEIVNVIDTDEVTPPTQVHQVNISETVNVIDTDDVTNLNGAVHQITASEVVNVIDSEYVNNLMGPQVHQVNVSETIDIIDSETWQKIGDYIPTGKYIWFNVSPPETDRLGGVYALDCGSGNYVQGIYTNGTLICVALPP